MVHDRATTSVREPRSLETRIKEYATSPGVHFPPGATVDTRGVNFSIFAPDAAIAELRLYERADSEAPSQTVVLDIQHGNNNAYCQDSELSWFDWRLLEANRDMLRFVRELIALRKRRPCLRRRRFLTGLPAGGSNLPDIAWHGEHLHEPRWDDGNSRLLAFTLAGVAPEEKELHVILNMAQEPRAVAIPVIANCKWRRTLDTALASPNDIVPIEQRGEQQSDSVNFLYAAEPRSVVVLEAE